MRKFRYDLTNKEMDSVEKAVTDYTTYAAPEAAVVGLVVGSTSAYADFARTGEQQRFDGLGENYNFAEGMATHESRSEFLLTVDQRPDASAVISHVKRIVYPRDDFDELEPSDTGIEMIDDRIKSSDPAEKATLSELLKESNLTINSLKKSVCVATNFTTERQPKSGERKGLGMMGPMLSYHFLVKYAHSKDAEAIIAYQNRAAALSIDRMRADKHLLGGKAYHLPKTTEGYDYDYTAYVIPGTEHNLDVFLGKSDQSPITIVLGKIPTKLLVDLV